MPEAWVPQDGMTRRVIAAIVSILMVAAVVVALSAGDLARADHADHAAAPTTGGDLPNAGALPKDPLCTLSYGFNGKSNWTGDPYAHEPGHPGGGPFGPAIWANSGSAGAETLDISGADNWIDGATVSRDDIKLGGSQNNFLHGFSYGGSFDLGADDNCFVSGPVSAAPAAGFPVTFSSADFAPGSTAAQFAGAAGEYYVCGFPTNGTTVKNPGWCDGDDLIVGDQDVTLPTGLYYIKGLTNLSGSNMYGLVTIVSLDAFDASGSSGSDFYAYMRGLLFMTDASGEDALKTGGSTSTFNEGHLFAPNGRVELSGSRNYFNCTVMGDRVRLNGQNLVIEGQLCDDGGPQPGELQVDKVADPISVYSNGAWVTYTVTLTNASGDESITVTELYENFNGVNSYDLLDPQTEIDHPDDIRNNNCDEDTPIVLGVPGSETDEYSCTFEGNVDGDSVSTQFDQDTCTSQTAKIDVVDGVAVGDVSTNETTDNDCAEVTIDPDPELTIVKSADPTTIFDGQTVTYTVELINLSETEDIIVDTLTDDIGDGPLNLLTFTPPSPIGTNTCNTGAVNGGDDATITVPKGGADNSVTCQFSFVVTTATTTYDDEETSCDESDKVDLVEASGEGEDSQIAVSDDDCAGVDIDPNPEFTVIKTAAPTTIYSGDTVTYTVQLVNHSDSEDVIIDILDDDIGDDGSLNLLAFTPPSPIVTNTCNAEADAENDATITVPWGGLANAVTCQFTVVVTHSTPSYSGEGDDDCDTYDKVDLVTASGLYDLEIDLDGGLQAADQHQLRVTDDDCAGVDILPDPMLALEKEVVTPAGGDLGPEGGDVTYKVTLTNLSTTESVTITEFEDDVDGKIYDLLDLTEDTDFVDNTCNDALPITIAADSSEDCTFTLFVNHETASAAGSHDSCTPGDNVIDIASATGVGDDSGTATNEADDCAEVTVEEPDASLAIDKLVWDETEQDYENSTFLASSATFPASVEWKITVSNPSEDKVINIVFTDTNASACVTAFDAAMDAIETDKDWLDPAEEVTFTCDGSVLTQGDIPFTNTAVANGDDVWDRPVDEVEDDAFVLQIDASGSIGDTVWYDCAGDDSTVAPCDDGNQDAGELGIENAKVTITGLDGQDVDAGAGGIQTTKSLLTDANGKYLFVSLPDGNYKVEVLIGDVPDPSGEGRTLRFTTASSFTILLPEGGERLDADFGVIADTLPETGISSDEIVTVALLLIAAGMIGLIVSRRREDELGTDVAA